MAMIQKIEIQILFHITASIFRERAKNVLFMSKDEALQQYAKCTSAWMDSLLVDEETDIDQSVKMDANKKNDLADQMYARMYRLGHAIRRILFIQSLSRAFKWIIYFYKNIGITVAFKTVEKGHIMEVSSCMFSRYYNRNMCKFMSMMDKGLICGLTNQSSFYFAKRITEGCKYCVAKLKMQNEEK